MNPNVCVYACMRVHTDERKANPNVHELLLSVAYCSICAPAFGIKPEILATKGTKKVKIRQDM